MRPLIRFSVAVGLAIHAGCSTEYYSVTTEVKSDGTIARKIVQPIGRLPAAGRQNWTKTRITRDYETAISGVEKPDPDNQAASANEYFVAEGTFESVGSIPDHYEQKSVDGSRSGHLKRNYTKNDYGFIVEHIWSEELTDPVNPEEFPEAVKELTRSLAEFNELGLREYLGNDIDIQPMTEWIENDGAEIILECLLVAMHQVGRQEGLFDSARTEESGLNRLKQIAERHGVHIENDDDFARPIGRFLRTELPQRIRYKDGRPIEDDRMRIIVQCYERTKDSEDDENACSAAFQRAIGRKYGDDLTELFAMLTPLLGVYGDRILGTPQSFEFSLQVPGLIVETNGLLVSDSQVRWKFGASDATIFGYRMVCRSVERIDKVCDRILNGDTLRTRGELIELLELARDEEVKTSLLEVATEKHGSGLCDLPENVQELLRRK